MKVAPLITVALILCIACPGIIQAKKKPKPKFCIGKNGNEYAVGDGYVDTEEDVCIRYRCVKKKKKVFMKENKCIDGEWSDWSSWSACTATCGNATRTKERTCSILPPITRGNQCSGPDEEIEECSLPKCSHVHRSGQNSIDLIWLEIANIKDGIKTNKAAIAGHHGVLLHTDANYEYYKVPVPASSKMTSDVVLTTCIKLGMKPQCFNAYYADNACVQAPSNSLYGLHPYEMSKILCSTTPPQSCASTLNMFWYMNPDKGWYSGSACGATKSIFCAAGKYYTSTSNMQYFAACLKPATTVTFLSCVGSWCRQSGTKDQFTRCESVRDGGLTCVNPEVRYGSTEGGIPCKKNNNDYDAWCQQVLGFGSNSKVTYGARDCAAPKGALFWCAGYDESGYKWCDSYDGSWKDATLDANWSCDTEAITSLTCSK